MKAVEDTKLAQWARVRRTLNFEARKLAII